MLVGPVMNRSGTLDPWEGLPVTKSQPYETGLLYFLLRIYSNVLLTQRGRFVSRRVVFAGA